MAAASFVTYHHKHRELPALEFRAPPPSPVTGVLTGGSSGSPEYGEFPDVHEDDDVGRFLRRSARVPVLRLPERAIPRKKKAPAWAPPVIDMRLLASGAGPAVEALRSAAVSFGCFQVLGHGVSACLVSAAARRAGSPASGKGAGGEEREDFEESWWSPGFAVSSRNRADDLFAQLERAAAQIMDALQRDSVGAGAEYSMAGRADRDGSSLLCIRTHHRKQRDSGRGSGGPMSQDDVLRMLLVPRALALHLCPGASTFRVFSAPARQGWSGFRPLDGAVVVTVGDRLQAWSGGLYKSVAGKPAYENDDLRGDGGDDVVSVELLHSGSSNATATAPPAGRLAADAGKIIPLNLQMIAAACLLLVYHLVLARFCAIWSS